ncbi:MAG: N-acetyltransferase [Mycobacterium sp.]
MQFGELVIRLGHTAVADRDNQRVFYYTEIDDDFGGRGLATILVREALKATRADSKHIVPVCEMVAGGAQGAFGVRRQPIAPGVILNEDAAIAAGHRP